MLVINKVKLYSFDTEKEKKSSVQGSLSLDEIELIGNKNATICCFISTSSTISESKDYKILSKVFEKLMLKVDNILAVNVMSCQSKGFIHFIQEFQLTKIIIFGDESILPNFPIPIYKNQPTKFEFTHILLTENLIALTESSNVQLKKTCWNAIQSFYKL